jgi:hypothetical protein
VPPPSTQEPAGHGAHRRASNLDVIAGALAGVWTSQGRRFATFEVAERPGNASDRWIQYLDGELNVRWDRDEEPAVALPRLAVALPRGAFLGWHQPRQNAVIEVGDVALPEVARLVLDLFEKVVAAGPGFRVAARVEDHA